MHDLLEVFPELNYNLNAIKQFCQNCSLSIEQYRVVGERSLATRLLG